MNRKYYTIRELYDLVHTLIGRQALLEVFPNIVNPQMYADEMVDTIHQWQLDNLHLFCESSDRLIHRKEKEGIKYFDFLKHPIAFYPSRYGGFLLKLGNVIINANCNPEISGYPFGWFDIHVKDDSSVLGCKAILALGKSDR